MGFPTVDQFNSAVKEANTMSKWGDLTVGEIYKIVDYKILDTQYGESMKLTVSHIKEDWDSESGSKEMKYTVWCPEIVKETFKTQETDEQKATYTHTRSNGLKPTRSGNKYWSFDVVEIEECKEMYR